MAVLYADLEDHFKKIIDKSGPYSMRNIDFIYLINLDERPEKFQACIDQLSPYGITPYRFSAVNGWKLSLEEINEVGVKFESWMNGGQMGSCYFPRLNLERQDKTVKVVGRTYFCHRMPRGSIGIVLSHLSILQDAYDSHYETIWVMEDDIEIIQNPHLLSDLIERLNAIVGKEQWDILFTDPDTKNQQGNYVICLSNAWRPNFIPSDPKRFAEKETIGDDFKRIGARYGAYSMIVRRSGMEKLLRFFKNYNIFLPFDMEYTLPNDIRLYALRNDVVSTIPQALSDNETPTYTQDDQS